MHINIIHEPADAKDYEFIVVAPLFNDEEKFECCGVFENENEAELCAKNVKGIILHNCNIQGKIRKKEYKVTMSFERIVTAISEEEAEQLFVGWYENIEDEDFFNAIKIKEIK